ncbi:MAG: glycosyltransferase family 39 protein [Longimicrobiales bacterium]
MALRLVALNAKALWFDETFSVFVASLPVQRLLTILAANEPHPPLHFLMLHAWMGVFGDSEAAVRAPSVLIGAAIVILTWLFGWRLIGPAPALVAAILVAVSPSQVAVGQEARMGALLVATALGSWWALWTATSGNSRRAWVAYVLTSAAMLYSHYYGFFVLASHAVYLVWRRTRPVEWRQWMIAGLGTLGLFIPWLPAFLLQMAGGKPWPAHRLPLTPAMFVDTFALMTTGWPVVGVGDPRSWSIHTAGTPHIALVGFVAALLLIAAGVRAKALQQQRALLLCAAAGPVIFAYAASLVVNVYAPRYLILIMPAIALLIGASLGPVIDAGRAWPKRVGPIVLLAALVVPNVLVLVSFYRQPALDVFDWRKVSVALAASARTDDAIVFLPGFSRIPVGYYFRGPQPRLALTPEGPDVLGPGGVRMSGIVSMLTQHPRVWLVTVPPFPQSVKTLMAALGEASYRVQAHEQINIVWLLLFERTRRP